MYIHPLRVIMNIQRYPLRVLMDIHVTRDV